MLEGLRTARWKRRATWLRGLGLALLLVAFFLPIPAAWLAAVLLPGLALFLVGAIAWLVRDEGPWLRR